MIAQTFILGEGGGEERSEIEEGRRGEAGEEE